MSGPLGSLSDIDLTGIGAEGYFPASVEHLLAELARIDLLVSSAISRAQQLHEGNHDLQGLYISEEEVAGLLTRPLGMPKWAPSIDGRSQLSIQTNLDYLSSQLAQRKEESARRGISLRLEELTHLFNLTGFEVDALLIVMAVELDLRYERLYGYLQDDITKKRPSLDLILNLLCGSNEEKLRVRRNLLSESPLFKYQLLYLLNDPSQEKPSLLSHCVKVDERIVNYVLDGDDIPLHLQPFIQVYEPKKRFDNIYIPEDVKATLLSLSANSEIGIGGKILYLFGPAGIGKQSLAEALCHRHDSKILVFDGGNFISNAGDKFEIILREIMREAMLRKAVLYVKDLDALQSQMDRQQSSYLVELLKERNGTSILSGEKRWEYMGAFGKKPFISLDFQRPNFNDRVQQWKSFLSNQKASIRDEGYEILANRFRLTETQIQDAINTAYNMVQLRARENDVVSIDDLFLACRMQSKQKLSSLASKVTSRYQWSDIVLPTDSLQQLHEICNAGKNRSHVYEKWGFGNKLSLGKGLNILFVGPPGTGKTMAAEIVAKDLEIDLYKIDLSQVVSKYIGDTEKNLNRIFQAAEADNTILFFDEADALFGKRTEVKDAHDRFANIETGYLLQKMEDHDGIVILSSNLRNNIDQAFLRRMYAIVEFPFPDEEHRKNIWNGLFPKEVPWDEPLDDIFLAKQFKLSGGHIKNIGVRAAFLAASEGKGITMRHIIVATKREYQKLLKPCTEADFGPYYKWVK